MTADRLQAAWRYSMAEIWQPLFRAHCGAHSDLPAAVVRTALDRSKSMAQLFVAPEQFPVLDRLRGDVPALLDSPDDAQGALKAIRPEFFINGRAVAGLLSEVAATLSDYESPRLSRSYRRRVQSFLERRSLPYRLDGEPLRLVPLLQGDVDALYSRLRSRAAQTPHLAEALRGFENAWDRQAIEWSQINAKEAIRAASLLAENMLISASAGQANEFSKAMNQMRRTNRFPSDDFASIFDRAYTFVNEYPNIRHPGNLGRMKRDLCHEDMLLAALVFVGLSACAHKLCETA